MMALGEYFLKHIDCQWNMILEMKNGKLWIKV